MTPVKRSIYCIAFVTAVTYVLLYVVFDVSVLSWRNSQIAHDINIYRSAKFDDVKECTLDTCFNFSHCPITKPFTVFFDIREAKNNSTFLMNLFTSELQNLPEITTRGEDACVVVLVDPSMQKITGNGHNKIEVGSSLFNTFKTTQNRGPFTDGINAAEFRPNQLLFRTCQLSACSQQMQSLPLNSMQVAAPDFDKGAFRLGFDILTAPLVKWHEIFPNIHKERENRLYFIDHSSGAGRNLFTTTVIEELRALPHVVIDVCSKGKDVYCYPQQLQEISRSTFGLLVASGSSTDANLNYIFVEILRRGTIPVIIGEVHLPFDTHLEWDRASIRLPLGRFRELDVILNGYDHDDVVRLRQQGKELFMSYLSTPSKVVRTVISCLRSSLKIPARRESRNFGSYIENLTFTNNSKPAPVPLLAKPYRREIAVAINFWRDAFNKDFHAHSSLPFMIRDRLDVGMEPNRNNATEQFTVIMVTYNRSGMLLNAVEHLRGLSNLHKLVVIWNGPQSVRPENLTWPDIGVPIQVVMTRTNDMTNRYLPFDAIETEAVLSMDDDLYMSHREVEHSFNVWRQNRDALVGQTIRHHTFKNGELTYTWNADCKYSLVLPRNAFMHVEYLFAFSNRLHPEARKIVSQMRNCDDLAMNFIIAHTAQRPPIYVDGFSTRNVEQVSSSPSKGISSKPDHLQKRTKCLQRFAEIFGYFPLRFSDLRIVSSYYGTHLSPAKCPRDI